MKSWGCVSSVYPIGKCDLGVSQQPGEGVAHLDLLDGVHDEGVLQILHGPLHPVVEGCSPLGILQVQLVNGLQQLLCPLQCQTGSDGVFSTVTSRAPHPHQDPHGGSSLEELPWALVLGVGWVSHSSLEAPGPGSRENGLLNNKDVKQPRMGC